MAKVYSEVKTLIKCPNCSSPYDLYPTQDVISNYITKYRCKRCNTVTNIKREISYHNLPVKHIMCKTHVIVFDRVFYKVYEPYNTYMVKDDNIKGTEEQEIILMETMDTTNNLIDSFNKLNIRPISTAIRRTSINDDSNNNFIFRTKDTNETYDLYFDNKGNYIKKVVL